MSRFDLCAPAYQSANFDADAQVCMNRYPELDEGSGGKARWILRQSPGLRTFTSLPMSAVTSIFGFKIGATERAFSVGADGALYEVFANSSFVLRGAVAVSTTPARIAANQTQLLIQSGGKLYRYTLATNALSAALAYSDTSAIPAITDIGMLGGFFLALIANSNKFQISALLDANTWDLANVAQILDYPDNAVSMVIDHKDVIFKGVKQTVFYYLNGNADFPFGPIPGAFMETGSAAILAAAKMDNTVYWVERNDRGSMMVMKLSGYQPQRVSNHAIETEWQSYSTTDDLVTYSFQLGGHTFLHLYFPTADKAWRFDAATQSFHEVGKWDPVAGAFTAHRSQCHAFVFGKHLVGDWASGQIFEMSSSIYDDFGDPQRRVRRSPYVAREGRYITFNGLEITGDFGQGLPSGQGSDPKLMLRFSDDRAQTWSNEIDLPFGQQGQFATRAQAFGLGTCWGTIGRVWEVADSEPIEFSITDGLLDADPDYKSEERLPVQARKGA